MPPTKANSLPGPPPPLKGVAKAQPSGMPDGGGLGKASFADWLDAFQALAKAFATVAAKSFDGFR